MSREPFDAATVQAPAPSNFVPGNETQAAHQPGRRKRHSSSADRKQAFRQAHARLDLSVSPRMRDTLDDLAQQLGCSRNDVAVSLFRFALTNRNWKQCGLWGTATPEAGQ